MSFLFSTNEKTDEKTLDTSLTEKSDSSKTGRPDVDEYCWLSKIGRHGEIP